MEISQNYLLDLMRVEGIIAQYASGEHLFRNGDAPFFLFYIRNGTVVITESQYPERALAKFSMGSILGVQELITGAAYRFSAVTEENSVLLRIDKTKFDDLFQHDSQFRVSVVKIISSDIMDRRGQYE
jgi:signal-transduction protein with cAMP-binding, CBS, and nucleotidyltransferase domain